MASKNQNSQSLGAEERVRTRGYIPHYEAGERTQMITYRLHDSLPSVVLAQFRETLKQFPDDKRDAKSRALIEAYLDQGMGSCVLQDDEIGDIVEENLLHFEGKRYRLHAWVIMPNHVHVLLTPKNTISLSEIVHSWKSYTAKKVQIILGKQSRFWQREYFDRVIRSEKHFVKSVEYIHNNPLKAGLCSSSSEWKHSSARRILACKK